jgi:hypothetical protein
MTRISWLLFGLALLLLAQPLAGPAGVQGQERHFTLDFTDAPLGDVLRVVFHDTPYTFTLDSDLEQRRVTITLREVSFSHALRAILSLHDLTYTTSGGVYHIMSSGSEPSYVDQFPYGPIVIYSRVSSAEERTEVVCRALTSPEERVLYTADGLDHPMPVILGYLPAPDASWLLLWHSRGRRGDETTSWLTFRLPDGAADELGETPGLPWLSALSPLPYWDRWDDHDRLVLLPGSCFFTPDLSTLWGALPGPETPIPEPSARGPLGDAQDRLTAYCEQHHQAEAEHLRAAFAKLANEMEVGYLGFDDPGASPYLLLLSLGIPSARSMGRDGWSIPTRHAACSPDGRLIAYADTWKHQGLPTPEGHLPSSYGTGARLDVFDVATGRRLWYARRPSAPRWVSEASKTVRQPIEWTHPRFADLRWSRDGRYLSFTTCEDLYSASEPSCNVTVLDVAQLRPVLYLPNGSNAFVITPPAAETAERP